MAAMDKQIVVSDFVDDYLKTKKDEDNHPTLDSVIRELIHDSKAYRLIMEEYETKKGKKRGKKNE